MNEKNNQRFDKNSQAIHGLVEDAVNSIREFIDIGAEQHREDRGLKHLELALHSLEVAVATIKGEKAINAVTSEQKAFVLDAANSYFFAIQSSRQDGMLSAVADKVRQEGFAHGEAMLAIAKEKGVL